MIIISDHNPAWPARFDEVRVCLLEELPEESGVVKVEHVGSTAVPELAAKPIIDIHVVIAEDAHLDPMIMQMAHLGYIYEGHSLHSHLVPVTKYRKKWLTPEMLDRLQELAGEITVRWGGRALEMNGERDHVHLLLRLPPSAGPARVVRSLKSQTSRCLRQEFRGILEQVYCKPVLWSRSYCLVSCGGAPLSLIQQYINQQYRPRSSGRPAYTSQ